MGQSIDRLKICTKRRATFSGHALTFDHPSEWLTQGNAADRPGAVFNRADAPSWLYTEVNERTSPLSWRL
jgi:hypothetical protein